MSKSNSDLTAQLLALRPIIDIEFIGEKNSLESFMHLTLRPVLKMQHQKLVTLIEQSEGFKIELCSSLDKEMNQTYLKNHLSKNAGLKQKLLGCVIGLFTEDEFDFFFQNQKEVSKRISAMIIERYLSSTRKEI
jgi:hypothetical protein